MKAYTSQAPAKLRIALKSGEFATVRFNESKGQIVTTKEQGIAWIRDGKTYSTENRMRSNRLSRPKNAKMIRVLAVGSGMVSFEILD